MIAVTSRYDAGAPSRGDTPDPVCELAVTRATIRLVSEHRANARVAPALPDTLRWGAGTAARGRQPRGAGAQEEHDVR